MDGGSRQVVLRANLRQEKTGHERKTGPGTGEQEHRAQVTGTGDCTQRWTRPQPASGIYWYAAQPPDVIDRMTDRVLIHLGAVGTFLSRIHSGLNYMHGVYGSIHLCMRFE